MHHIAHTHLIPPSRRLLNHILGPQDSETRARAALAETERRAEDLQFRLASTERCLGEESERADEAERAAREEASRAQSLASDSREIARLLEDTRKRAAEAEQRAAREEERTRAFAARAAEDNDHLVTLRTALEQQAAAVEEGKNRAKDREKALEAAGREAEFALNKAHDAKEEERMRAEDAEAQAQRAFLRNQELVKLLGERDASLRKASEKYGMTRRVQIQWILADRSLQNKFFTCYTSLHVMANIKKRHQHLLAFHAVGTCTPKTMRVLQVDTEPDKV